MKATILQLLASFMLLTDVFGMSLKRGFSPVEVNGSSTRDVLGMSLKRGLNPVEVNNSSSRVPEDLVLLDNEDHPAPITFKKTPKTGSKTLEEWLRKAVKSPIREIPETSTLFPRNATRLPWNFKTQLEGTFIIASIRNPCEMLLSLWSFASQGRGAFHKCQGAGPFSKTYDKEIFREWVLAHPGLVTRRLFRSYATSQLSYNKDFHCDFEAGQQDAENLLKADLSHIDCMIHTETLHEDSQICFQDLERRGFTIDWTAFASMSSIRTHETTHSRCASYFDEDLSSFVWKHDAAVFHKFGYNTCCATSL